MNTISKVLKQFKGIKIFYGTYKNYILYYINKRPIFVKIENEICY